MTDLTTALYARITAAWLSLRDEEKGQGMVEYALVLVLVAVAVALLTQWGTFTGAITTALGKVITALNNNG